MHKKTFNVYGTHNEQKDNCVGKYNWLYVDIEMQENKFALLYVCWGIVKYWLVPLIFEVSVVEVTQVEGEVD